MSLCETENRPEIGDSNGENGLYASNDIPCNEYPAPSVVEAKRHAEIDSSSSDIDADLEVQRQTGLFVSPCMPKDAGVLNGEHSTRYAEYDGYIKPKSVHPKMMIVEGRCLFRKKLPYPWFSWSSYSGSLDRSLEQPPQR